MSKTPSLTAKAVSELLQLPAYEQLRVLHEQKYPRRSPQIFKAPYYGPAVNGIQAYYRTSGDAKALTAARIKVDQLGNETRRTHNHRILDSFPRSAEATRSLRVRPKQRFRTMVGPVEIRLAADLLAYEDGHPLVIYYNCRSAKLDAGVARTALEIGHYVLEENGVVLPLRQIQYVDFMDGQRHSWPRPRKTTVTKLEKNATVIEVLWNSI